MNIGIDIRHLAAPDPSGVGSYTLHLIRQMALVAPQTRFLLFASGSSRALAYLPDFSHPNIAIKTVRLPNRVISSLLKFPAGPALEDLIDEKPDVWLFPNINMIRTRLPYAITVHDVSFKIYKEFFRRKDRAWHRVANVNRLLDQAACILAVSESTKQDLEHLLNVPKDKIHVVYHGVEEHFHPNEELQDKNFLQKHGIDFPYLLTLSTLEPRKNIESVIEAYDAWRSNSTPHHSHHLVIAGGRGWKTDGIDTVLRQAKHKDDIHLIGYVPERHKPALYRHATAFLFPSFYEGFGLPALEAMACGTPVITSFTGSMPEVVNDAAIMIDPYNVTDLEQALGQVVDLPLREILRQRGLQRARQFTWEKTAHKTLEALQKIQK
ncbi:glycosyltransferase family 4 protein [Patescibacteria group bacterium]|nr:glycosyltransferase family 4 protein [Patescibacteria group bacterium]